MAIPIFDERLKRRLPGIFPAQSLTSMQPVSDLSTAGVVEQEPIQSRTSIDDYMKIQSAINRYESKQDAMPNLIRKMVGRSGSLPATGASSSADLKYIMGQTDEGIQNEILNRQRAAILGGDISNIDEQMAWYQSSGFDPHFAKTAREAAQSIFAQRRAQTGEERAVAGEERAVLGEARAVTAAEQAKARFENEQKEWKIKEEERRRKLMLEPIQTNLEYDVAKWAVGEIKDGRSYDDVMTDVLEKISDPGYGGMAGGMELPARIGAVGAAAGIEGLDVDQIRKLIHLATRNRDDIRADERNAASDAAGLEKKEADVKTAEEDQAALALVPEAVQRIRDGEDYDSVAADLLEKALEVDPSLSASALNSALALGAGPRPTEPSPQAAVVREKRLEDRLFERTENVKADMANSTRVFNELMDRYSQNNPYLAQMTLGLREAQVFDRMISIMSYGPNPLSMPMVEEFRNNVANVGDDIAAKETHLRWFAETNRIPMRMAEYILNPEEYKKRQF